MQKSKFKVGDKVRFLNESGEGVITSLDKNGMVRVSVEGFEIPFPQNQLVNITSVEEPEEFTSPSGSTKMVVGAEESIYLVFEPSGDLVDSDLLLHFINTTEYDLLYSIATKKSGQFFGMMEGKLENKSRILVQKIPRTQIEQWCEIKVQALFHKKGPFEDKIPLNEYIKLKPTRFYRESNYSENLFTGNKAFVIDLKSTSIEDYSVTTEVWNGEGVVIKNIAQHVQNKESSGKSVSVPHTKHSGVLEKEVDLHIEELLDNTKGMSNAEIIQVQLRHFQRELDDAIARHMHKVTFIHGIGNGRLKSEVQRILKSYEGIRFYDAPYSRYGFGATEVVIK